MSADPATLYSALLATTFGLHLWLVAGVVWGTAAILAGAFRRREPGPLERALRDWLPFLLSAAITAGVAPLLFVQVLHPRAFCSASRLLAYRWFALLPVLVVGFYLLYALKSGADRRGGALRRIATPALALCAFAYVGATFSRNHLLSLGDSELWAALVSGDAALSPGPLVARLAVLAALAAPLAASHVLWAVGVRDAAGREPDPRALCAARGHLAGLALAGLALATAAALLATAGLGAGAALSGRGGGLAGKAFSAAGGLVMAGFTLTAAGWLGVRSAGGVPVRLAVYVGSVLLAVGVGFAREGGRIARLAEQEFRRRAADAGTTAGLGVFLACLLLCSALGVLAVRLAGRSAAPSPAEGAGAER